MKKSLYILIGIIIIFVTNEGFNISAHPGRTDSSGGHYNRGTGEYHYHNGGSSSSSSSSNSTSSSSTISNKPTSISIKSSKTIIYINDITYLTYSLYPSYSYDTITWTSSNINIATVSSDGKLIAHKPGKVTITVKASNGVKDEIVLNILSPLKKDKITIAIGEAYNIISTGLNNDISLMTYNDDIAYIDSNNRIVGKSKGKTTVYARINGAYSWDYECEVTVVTYRLKEVKSKLSVEELLQLTPIGRIKGKEITWSSDNNSVASVDDEGIVIANKKGTANIICKIGKTTIIKKITVE